MMSQQVTMHDNYHSPINGAFPYLNTIRYSYMHPFSAFEDSSLANLNVAANRFGRHVILLGSGNSLNQKLNLARHDSSLNL